MRATLNHERDPLLTVAEVATELNCCPSTVYNLIHNGDLAVVRVGRRKGYRINASDLEHFRQANQTPAAKRQASLAPPKQNLKSLAKER